MNHNSKLLVWHTSISLSPPNPGQSVHCKSNPNSNWFALFAWNVHERDRLNVPVVWGECFHFFEPVCVEYLVVNLPVEHFWNFTVYDLVDIKADGIKSEVQTHQKLYFREVLLLGDWVHTNPGLSDLLKLGNDYLCSTNMSAYLVAPVAIINTVRWFVEHGIQVAFNHVVPLIMISYNERELARPRRQLVWAHTWSKHQDNSAYDGEQLFLIKHFHIIKW